MRPVSPAVCAAPSPARRRSTGVVGAGLLVSLLLLPGVSAGDDLDTAFLRERAQLLAEREELQRTLTELLTAGARRHDRAEAALGELAAQLQQLRTEADRLEATLAHDAARDPLDPAPGAGTAEELRQSLQPALRLLAGRGSPPPDDGLDATELLAHTFAAGLATLREDASIRLAPGEFFDERGAKVSGTVLHLGAVAALGVAEPAGGALAPAGGGRLMVVDRSALPGLRAWMAQQAPARLRVHLFDPRSGPPSAANSGHVEGLLRQGGLLVWPILGLGLLALLVALERVVTLFRARHGGARLLAAVLEAARAGAWQRAAERCAGSGAALAPVLAAALAARGLPHDARRDRVEEALLAQAPRLERHLGLLHVVAAVAPLLGLLGTVTGMIATFAVITRHGTGDPRLLAGGISEALVTTELGLVVAIPTLLLHAWLAARIDRTLDGLEEGALRVSNVAARLPSAPAVADPPPDEEP